MLVLIGAICTGACLAQGYAPQNLVLADLQTPHARPSPSERFPQQRVLHAMAMHIY
jgi:hypothetical protein